ncbi:hypothetical protein TPHA_0D03460 [Tetrapisispora phaffii CBS 4417]|uniref:Zinc-regulated protein 8 n=1 Tax=Tetrapisispora phaffii (strain ATCC 24235 / CBS 4417 / NBRC 1672 / NRRL Y-8282 / UCD 70-5) TaxID=1071381 RepID=G8BT10_TETPH|nr:hypothetical protein TPHA_0D03460 [Tetrapisispora phaffii CBS 4417]CCE62981.1 hypothetical protein TPHA_0D03460 [Tetrapisispora phaffii CBS 4417]
MRSFIKSHRSSNSLDGGTGRFNDSNNQFSPKRHNNDLIDVSTNTADGSQDSTHWNQYFTSNVKDGEQSLRHAPSFDSFHRLTTNKMFSGILFKRNNTSGVTVNNNSQTNIHYDKSPTVNVNSIPFQFKNDDIHSPTLGRANNNNTMNGINHGGTSISSGVKGHAASKSEDLAIKGTITHSWGTKSDVGHSVIKLNEPIIEHEKSNGIKLNKVVNSSVKQKSVLDTRNNTEQISKPIDESELKITKTRNRSVRIHSKDDLHKMNSASLIDIKDPTFDKQYAEVISKGLPKTIFKEDTLNNLPDSEEEYITDDLESESGSEFSFEYGAVNGRTSSMKYYSEQNPPKTVYINDMYEDENFDENMNFYEDGYDDELDFPSNKYDFYDEEDFNFEEDTYEHNDNNDNKNVVTNDKMLKTEEKEGKVRHKNLNNYNDLFELSDDDDDNDIINSDTDEYPSTTYDDLNSTNDEHNILKNNTNEKDQNENVELESVNLLAKTKVKSQLTSMSDIFNIDDEKSDIDEYNKFNFEEDQYDDENKLDSFNYSNTRNFENHRIKSKIKNNVPVNQIGITVTSENDSTIILKHTTPHLGFERLAQDSSNDGNTTLLISPTKSHSLKIHDINSNLDSDIPGSTRDLFFIDETKEDAYLNNIKLEEESYLDEINIVPEDFDFSEPMGTLSCLTSISRQSTGSFRRTHSFSEKPIGNVKENNPLQNKLEIKNKTITFFNNQWNTPVTNSIKRRSPRKSSPVKLDSTSYIDNNNIPTTPKQYNDSESISFAVAHEFEKPKPEYIQDFSLSPIQEGSSSVDSSPRL